MVLSDVTNRQVTASPAMAWLRKTSTTNLAGASCVAVCTGAPRPPTAVAQLWLPTRSSDVGSHGSAFSDSGGDGDSFSDSFSDSSAGSNRTHDAASATQSRAASVMSVQNSPPESSRQKLRDAVLAWSQAVDVSLGSCPSLSLTASVIASPDIRSSPGKVSSPSSPVAQSPSLNEPWPSPSAFGTPRAPSPSARASPCVARHSPSAAQGSMRVLPRLIQKFEKMRTELATHKADAASLRSELKEEKQRSAMLARAVSDKSSELAQMHLELHEMQTANSALYLEVEQARERLADSNHRARQALLSISGMAS